MTDKKAEDIIYVSFTIWGELEYGNGPLFWDGEKWSDDMGVHSFTDENEARSEFVRCQDDLDNIKNVRLVKSIVYENKPDVKDIVLEEKEG